MKTTEEKILLYVHISFLDAVNHYIQAISVYKKEAKKSEPWNNTYIAYRMLLKWCEAVRDNKLLRTHLEELQAYLDKSPRYPVLEYKLTYGNSTVDLSGVSMDMQIHIGNEDEKEFDKDKTSEFGLVAINNFADYLNGLKEGTRRKISDCKQCGKWFEWSGRGHENKFCSRKCRNRYNYLTR